MGLNKCQTSIDDLNLNDYPLEVVEKFYNFINNVPFIRNMISSDRLMASDIKRDNDGKIIIDLTKPHILKDMDYFRPSAIHFEKYGCYTKMIPNGNPNSPFGKWLKEEIRRCWYGYVRESDGEWITGDHYYYLNYCPIQGIKHLPNGQSIRTLLFPIVWDGQYLMFHYLNKARCFGHHAFLLASRGKGKSFSGAAMLAKRFKLGENEYVTSKVMSSVTASDKKYIWGPNQILNMFKYYIDFQSINTEFPRQLLTDSVQTLTWESGYKDKETGLRMGSQNMVIGVTTGVNQDKLNGSRGVLYLIEEAGIFNNLGNLYQMIRPSVEDGSDVYGLIYAYGTAGDEASDFSSMQEIMDNPIGYNVQENENVWDIEGEGKKYFSFFFPAYLNRANCMDADGNSDITKALLEICMDRHTIKYNTTDINAITKRITQYPITPREAIQRTTGSIFPVTALNEQLNTLDNDPNVYDKIYTGELVLGNDGKVTFKPSTDNPIRKFPLKSSESSNLKGAVEIYQMPVKDREGNVQSNRYIAGMDPYDNDQSDDSVSLGSVFVFDLLLDRIVAEYTGRPTFAEDLYETARLLCLFYNATLLYESNKKGIYPYFSKMNSMYLLADTPKYLRDRGLVKYNAFGNNSKGVNASAMINEFANDLIIKWLLKPVIVQTKENGEAKEITKYNLHFIFSRALLQELIKYNPNINVDRIRALGMVMIYREEKMILFQGDMSKINKNVNINYLGDDKYFTKNFRNGRFSRKY